MWRVCSQNEFTTQFKVYRFILILPVEKLNVQEIKNGWARGYISGSELTGTYCVWRWLAKTQDVRTVVFIKKWKQLVELKIKGERAATCASTVWKLCVYLLDFSFLLHDIIIM